MTMTHTEQCEHIDEHISEKLCSMNEDIKDFIIIRLNEHESIIMKEILEGNKRITELEQALSPYKFGWRVFIFIGGVVMGGIYFLLEILRLSRI